MNNLQSQAWLRISLAEYMETYCIRGPDFKPSTTWLELEAMGFDLAGIHIQIE